MKKVLVILSLALVGLAIGAVPLMATAHETRDTVRVVGGCDSLQPGQQRSCRGCINQGSHHYHSGSGTCHPNTRRPRKQR